MLINFLRGTAGYTLLGLKRNEEILEKLGVEWVENKVQNTNIMYQEWETPEFQNGWWFWNREYLEDQKYLSENLLDGIEVLVDLNTSLICDQWLII